MTDFPAFEGLLPHIDSADAFCEALRRPLPTTVWANPLRTMGTELRSMLAEIGVDSRHSSWHDFVLRLDREVSLGRTFPYLAGLLHIQEEASILAAAILEAKPLERILDVCAAPGGKTAWLGVQMNGRGHLLANDISTSRAIALRANLDRLGVINAVVTHHDAVDAPFPADTFDAVLADVPCTCTGTVRRNPSAAAAQSLEALPYLMHTQRAILQNALRACRPGGRLLYTTCSFLPEENEMAIDDALNHFEMDLAIEPIEVGGITFSDPLMHWEGRRFAEAVANTRRLHPHVNDTGGFFYALIRRLS
jgi:NOL1/NOP2/sun family putative RNA methylase